MITDDEINEIIFQVLISYNGIRNKYIQHINKELFQKLITSFDEVVSNENVILRLDPDIFVVGDIHGSISGLVRIFQCYGYPPEKRYLFLGDYIDRGENGTEVIMLLFALKIKFPQHVYLLRGNHESSICRDYGFSQEILGKYNDNVLSKVIDVFDEIPICAVIGEKIFCVHGGISPKAKKLNELDELPKPNYLLGSDMFTDFVWSDPDKKINGFKPNSRGCGYFFGKDALDDFLKKNKLSMLIRSHQYFPDGSDWSFDGSKKCLTIFSAFDYCNYKNSTGIVFIDKKLSVNIETLRYIDEIEFLKQKDVYPSWLHQKMCSKRVRNSATDKRRLSSDIDVDEPYRFIKDNLNYQRRSSFIISD